VRWLQLGAQQALRARDRLHTAACARSGLLVRRQRGKRDGDERSDSSTRLIGAAAARAQAPGVYRAAAARSRACLQ
jgi:hypothetical protein